MSGHSHYATIKRKKEARDAQRGKLFSKLSRAISVAVKTGGGPDPDANSKLRMAIEQAKAANMPKDNIKRAIDKGKGSGENLEEFSYEGFGPHGIYVLVEVATDNRNRAGQEIKNIFERGGGHLAGPGAVSFNFDRKGLIVVKKKADFEEQFLKLIDMGVEDAEDSQAGIEVYVSAEALSEIVEKLKEARYKILSSELVMRPKNYTTISEVDKAAKTLSFLDDLEQLEDVQKVYVNLDIPQETLEQIGN
jgi:YebC/PmpR family DNA-binding regulatory protein